MESEVKDLRQKVHAYSSENEALKSEKIKVLDTLSDLQETVQKIAAERDNYLLSVEDLERSNQDLQTKYSQLGGLMDGEMSKKRSLEEKLRSSQAELDVVGASLHLARETGAKHKQDLDEQ